MLKRVARVMAVLMLFAGAVVGPSVAAPVAAVAGPCTGGGNADNEGNIGGGVNCPGEDGDDGGSNGGGGGGGGGGGSRQCEWGSYTVPCVTKAGVLIGGCYQKLMDPQPAKDANVWGDHTDGYIVMCTPPAQECIDAMDGATEHLGFCTPSPMWREDPPPTDVGPSPEELAQRAYARMQLTMGEIGSTPPSTEVDGGSIGLVGMPVWLWKADGVVSDSETESDGDLSVTVEGRLDRTVWTLTDDDTGEVYATTTCAGARAPGTAWSAATGHGDARPSPTCGFDGAENRRSGHITVTATAYWTAEWAGGGLEGTIDVPAQTREATLAIGEAQVLVQ